ncbi:MAG: putative C-S lyase [Bacteroidales bacterium]|jgi:cysteine-S-conjugate beta-lyase|nr:putative C-S lyase [Bacteroidales bacterium]
MENKYNFDEILNRKGTYSYKYDTLTKYFGRDDITPLWVADMEFRSPSCIKEVLQQYIDSDVYGYNVEPSELKPIIAYWLEKEHSWKVHSDSIVFIAGIVRGIGYVINYFTKPGDKIVIQSPVYHPFTNVPQGNGRIVLRNPLKDHKMDLDHLEKLLNENPDTKMIILCNPHNPGGYMWTREELISLAEICYSHQVLVLSDEIHSDLALWGNKNIPFASVSQKAADICITLGAPSKTFNIPGFAASFAVVTNLSLSKPFFDWLEINELCCPCIVASLAMMAAYTKGKPWRDAAVKYIEDNIFYLEDKFTNFKGKDGKQMILPIRPQSSYLVWLDCRPLLKVLAGKEALEIEDQSLLEDFFINKVGIALNSGIMFGDEGLGFMRLNAACPRSMLDFNL